MMISHAKKLRLDQVVDVVKSDLRRQLTLVSSYLSPGQQRRLATTSEWPRMPRRCRRHPLACLLRISTFASVSQPVVYSSLRDFRQPDRRTRLDV